MAAKDADQIKNLYTELAKIAPSQDWERILKSAKKILGLAVNEKKAFHTKIVCLINLDRFDEALSSIERFQDASDFVFEKAYCEYKLNKIEKAYETLTSCQETTVKEKELLAQVAYRLEKYQESYDVYRDIIKNINDEYDAERQTNLAAVVASLRNTTSSTKDLDMTENENRTYELCYNSACISLSKGNYEEAQEKLKKAEAMCRKSFEDDQENEADVEDEMSIIRAQLAYCLQKLGKNDEASKIYNNLLKAKPSDQGVVAVASNNLVCINNDQNIFDSKKRIKMATSPEVEFKLNSFQKRLISYNEILFSIMSNQNDAVQKLLKQYESKFNDRERFSLLRMSQLYKEKKYGEAEKVLRELIKEPCSAPVKYYLIQILLLQGKVNEAVEIFKTLDEYNVYRLGITSALVSLYNNKNNSKEISKLFENAIDHFSRTNPRAKELEVYIKENSNFQIQSGNLQSACEMLEKMRSMNPQDFKILSKLINIYSKFDAGKAQKLSKELPSLDDIAANSNIDVDSLENQFSSLSFKYSKLNKSTVGTGGIKSPGKSTGPSSDPQAVEKQKKKRKRKVNLPKNYDPHQKVDPERWIPLRERSYYRGKRNKKKNQIGKGTQGAVSSRDGQEPSSPRPGVPNSPQAAQPEPEKPKIKLSIQQKKKKKPGNKW